jgi:hypothetical protein
VGRLIAIFSLVDGVLLRPLDYREPERLVAISQASPKFLKLYPALPINIATAEDEAFLSLALAPFCTRAGRQGFWLAPYRPKLISSN